MKYLLSQVQSTRDDRLAFAGVGFNIVNERGARSSPSAIWIKPKQQMPER
jgi:hypothetical protein